jgi:hypothetical protein
MMGTAKHIGRIGALAVALGVGIAGAAAPGVAMGETADPADTTALMLCGTTCPAFDAASVEIIMNQFIKPTHPDQTIRPVAVTAPGEAWPITGLFRLLELVVADPRLGAFGGPAWPDEPWWKLSGLFDLTGDQSIEAGVANLETAMADYPNKPLVIYGYSQGAVVAVKEKRKLAEQYPAGTTAPDIDFVLAGDASVPNGGFGARFPGLHIPVLDWTYDGSEPTDTQFDTTVITRQYDGFADFPLYPLNVIADLNAVLGILYVHSWPFEISLPADPTTSPAYQGTHGDSSYYLFETQDLPLFAPLRQLGVPEALIDVVEPFFKVIVELGYDRTIKPWEPTPARLLPSTLDPTKVVTDLVNAVGEGVDNAAALVGLPAALTGPTPARVAALRPVDATPKIVSGTAAKANPTALTAPAGEELPAPTAPVAQQNLTAAPTGLGTQTTSAVSTKPTARWNPTRVMKRTTQQNPEALTPAADNAFEPAAKPKPTPSATTLTPKALKPAGPSATLRPAGQPTHDESARHDRRRNTAGSGSDRTSKAGPTSGATPAGSTGSNSPGGSGS